MAYDKGWAAVNRLIRAGRSFSGRERNCCFLNLGGPRFATVSGALDVNLPDDSRGLAITDWDGDGRIDFWMTNRTGPRVRFLKNEYDSGHHYLSLQLRGIRANRDAIGARVEVYLKGQSRPLLRTVYGGSGYISQSSKTLLFGLGDETHVDRIVVKWPGRSEETFGAIESVDRRYVLVEGSGRAREASVPRLGPWKHHPAAEPTLPRTDRVVLLNPAPLPDHLQLQTLDGQSRPLVVSPGGKRGVLVNLWATWCANCLEELSHWSRDRETFERAGIHVVTVCVDQPTEDRANDLAQIVAMTEQMQIPFDVAVGTPELVETWNVFQRAFIGKQTDLPLPSSFLLDAEGRMAVVYKGPVDAAQVVADSRLLGLSREAIFDGAIPFPGRWLERPPVTSPRMAAVALLEHGYTDAAERYARQLLRRMDATVGDGPSNQATTETSLDPNDENAADAPSSANEDRVSLRHLIGAILFDREAYEEARVEYLAALELSPEHRDLRQELARTCLRLERFDEAAEHLSVVLKLQPENAELWAELARIRVREKRFDVAAECFGTSLKFQSRPDVRFEWANALRDSRQFSAARDAYREVMKEVPSPVVMNNLAWLLATAEDQAVRDGQAALELAEKAATATQRTSARILGTLAAAQAEVGRFQEALATLDEAIRLATEKEPGLVAELQQRRGEYASQRPTRE